MCTLLIDTVSIQEYIFGSNKLKDNIGASYLVGSIFNKEILEQAGFIYKPDNIGYIGGGNAILFFESKEKAKEFISRFSIYLIMYAPGLNVAFSIDERKMDKDNFKSVRDKLFTNLTNRKRNLILPQTILSNGITENCSRTGLSKNIFLKANENDYVSSESYAKNKASDSSLNYIKEKYSEILKNKYIFTNELEKLGSTHGEKSKIAIVHIDGNGIGDLFNSQESLTSTKELSKLLEESVESSFKHVLEVLINEEDKIAEEIKISIEGNKKILPIRPIIIGGDDITFVCDAKLGIYLAKVFLETFQKFEYRGKNLTACAGVAITNLKYPFYRGYELAESLCVNAKSKHKDKGGSWIDFQDATGEWSGDLSYNRKKHYMNGNKQLYLKPFHVNPNVKNELELNYFIQKTSEFLKKDPKGKKLFPNNKLFELREILYQSDSDRKYFLDSLSVAGISLPEYEGKNYHKDLFVSDTTPYLENIDLLSNYPNFKLQELLSNKK